MNLREILKDLGFIECLVGEDGEKYYAIKSTDPILDVFPVTLEDDGMGYGVNRMYISDVDKTVYDDKESKSGDKVFNLWRESYNEEEVKKLVEDSKDAQERIKHF